LNVESTKIPYKVGDDEKTGLQDSGAYCGSSGEGPIISIFHQHDLGNHGRFIHPSYQEHNSKNIFDDRSMKVGDISSSTATGGFIMLSLVSIPGCQPSVGFPNMFPHRCSVSNAHACKEQLFRDSNDLEYYVVMKIGEVPKNWKSRRER
jgi:hypothetical protein